MNAGSYAPALVLNADFRPLNYFPLSLWSWQDAVKAVCLDRVTIVSEYDYSINSPSMEMKLPSVIALKEYVPQVRNPALPLQRVSSRQVHLPVLWHRPCRRRSDIRSCRAAFQGGRTTWQNVVAACSPCNLRKANKLPAQCGMTPLSKPVAPNIWQLQENGRGFPPNYLHESWRDYLYWDTELQQT